MVTRTADYVVVLSRLQFAITMRYRILRSALTIGLSLFLVVTESLVFMMFDIGLLIPRHDRL
jgi:cytochrome bd-type quinol oxidase subunit 1